jgi:threonine/homoserine/homoserine lactone efflux protein
MPSDLSFLPAWTTLVPFLAASVALYLTPGVDMAFIAITGSRQGARAGTVAALGISGGCIVHTLAAAIGVSALIMASQTLFTALKVAGAAYLVYLAWKMLRTPAQGPAVPASQPEPAHGYGRIFSQAALINILNPKVGIFMMAFLPQFVDPARGHIAWQILALGLLFNICSIPSNTAVAVLAARASRRFRASPLLGRIARWIAATILGGLALRLALSDRT